MLGRVVLFFGLTLGVGVFAQVPLAINGIADRGIYTDKVAFWVPVSGGYSYLATLDGARVALGVTNLVDKVDYHEVTVWRTNAASAAVTNFTARFIVESSGRGDPEKGLIVWTPYPPIPSTSAELAGAELHLVMPQDYPVGLDIPVTAWVDDSHDRVVRANGSVTMSGFGTSNFRLVRGHGFGFLPPASTGGAIDFTADLATATATGHINVESGTTWTALSGTIASDATWANNSRIYLTNGLNIPAGVTLTIGAGTIVKLDALVNVTNSGSVIINGTLSQPVVFTPLTRPAPEKNAGAWGGFIIRGGRLIANGAILTGGGGASSFNFSPGSSHKSEQALLLVHSNATGKATALLTNCFLVNQAGQIMNGYNSDITFDHCLLQRAVTGGESVGGTIILNHSAVFEFPAIDDVYNAAIADGDYDAIYFTTGTHILQDSLIGFSKDDAIDSGSGADGTVLVTNCWIESALHEALAWSGQGRLTWTYDTVNINCGQGIEAGWTQGSANGSPYCFAQRLLSTANSVGARFGDNYDWTYYGFLRLTNSLLLYNHRDVFAKTWNTSGSSWNTNQWVDRLAQMDLRSNYLTLPDSHFPSNAAWNASADAGRLAPFMTTPAAAPVGVGFAVWTNQFAISTLFGGVPVRLSSFTTNSVAVDYSFSGPGGVLATGTLTFAPGETLKSVYPAGFNVAGQSPLHLVLSTARGGEITGVSDVTFLGTMPAVTASAAVTGTQIGMERMSEGVPLWLNTPSAAPVTVQYRYSASSARILGSGTAVFAPGQTLAWTTAPGSDVASYGIVCLDLFAPAGAALVGPTNLFFVASAEQPQPVTFVSRGARWRYLDDGSNQGTAWRERIFADGGWASGLAELGFGEGDEATIISRTNHITGTTNITFYFRSSFVETNVGRFTNLSMWLLYDDGGVIYLNGKEVFRTTNMPAGTIAYNTFTTSTGENSEDSALLSATNLVSGTNVAAVEIHQYNLSSSDISFNFELIGNPISSSSVPPELQSGVFGGRFVLGWGDSSFVLEQAPTVTGAWTQVTAPSPIAVPMTNSQTFYRLRR